MTQILPRNLPPAADGAAAELEATLARLPDEWTLLPRRRIGGEGGAEAGIVLIHPEIGAALLDLDPARLAEAHGALERLVAHERIAQDGETLPIVAVALGAGEIADVGDRLAASFESAPRCDMRDARWPDRLIDALLSAEDAAMAPLRLPRPERETPPPLPLPEPPAQIFRIEPEDAPILHDDGDDDPAPAGPRRVPSWAALALGVLILAGGAGTAFFLANEAAGPPPHVAAIVPPLPIPVTPAPPPPTPPSAAASLAPKPAVSLPPAVAIAPPPPPEPVPMPEVASAPSPPPQPLAPIAAAPPTSATASPPPTPPAPPKSMTPSAPPKTPVKAEAVAAAARAKQPAPPPKSEKTLAKLEPKPAAVPAPVALSPEGSGPPIDARDLPALDGSDTPPPNQSAAAVPAASPVMPSAPYYGAPAPGAPVRLLPQPTAPAAMPTASGGPAIGGLVGSGSGN